MSAERDRLQKTLGDSYTIERELGGGGMSHVYVANDSALGRQVVIKVLPEELSGGVNADRFKREIQLAAQLQHPHIVPLLSAGVSDGLPFYTMPLIEGESLRARLSRVGELPVAEATHILRDIAKALSYAHRHGVVHRDIKPENVLISDETALVTDFGVAKALSAATSSGDGTLTSLGVALGTPAYMSPEQASADPAVDHRADIYSLGAVGYELLTGRPPFNARTPQAMLAAHIAEAPESVTKHRPTVSPALDALVMKCLEKRPSDRPQSAAEIVQQLDALATPTAGTKLPSSTGAIGAQGAAPLRKAAFVLGAAILIALGVLTWRRIGGQRSVDRGVLAVLPFRVAGADPSLHYLREGMLDLLATKLTGGDVRTADARSLLAVWRREGGSENADIPAEAAFDVARALGAGAIVLGDVVGTPNHVVISAAMQRVPDGTQIAKASVEGPADSLARLIDRLAAQLLSLERGEAEDRLPSLTSTSLPALHAYLDGQRLYRRGNAAGARRRFEDALHIDSTFALAGLGLQIAVGWGGVDSVSERTKPMVWRERAKLSGRDQALLEAVVGPSYPLPSTVRQVLQACERYVALAPDEAEGWFQVGDMYYHFGAALGISQPVERAMVAFRKSLALDSTFGITLRHATHAAIELGDSVEARRYAAIRLAADTSRDWVAGFDIHYAAAFHREEELAKLRQLLDSLPALSLSELYQSAASAGVAIPETERAGYARVRNAETDRMRRTRYVSLSTFLYSAGRPHAADSALRASFESPSDPRLLNLQLWTGLFWDGDSAIAHRAALRAQEMIASSSNQIPPAERERAAVLTELWRLGRGDTSRTRETMSYLLDYPNDSARITRQYAVSLIQAVSAAQRNDPRADSLMAELDSLARQGAIFRASSASGTLPMVNLILARYYASHNHNAEALAAIRRREHGLNGAFLTAPMLREEGRIAAAAGDVEGAIRAYRAFLNWHYNPEPALRPERDAIRQELAKLERRSAGK